MSPAATLKFMSKGVSTIAGMMIYAFGFLSGGAYMVARRAWRDVTRAQRSIPRLRKTAWEKTGTMALYGVVGFAVAVFVVLWLMSQPATGVRPTSAVPSPTPSSSHHR